MGIVCYQFGFLALISILYLVQVLSGVVGWCWVNFQCGGVLLIWSRVGQGSTALAVGAGGDCLDVFSLVYHFSFFLPLSGRRSDID